MTSESPPLNDALAERTTDKLTLLVRQIRFEATGIQSYELVDPAGADLPDFTPGAHLDVDLGGGLVRQYSLSNDPAERHRYVVAVLRDEQGRGGSKTLHQTLQVQGLVSISRPRNHFHLDDQARKVILLAGGIGITPLKAMAHALDRTGADFELHYCAKGPGFAAFGEELRPLEASGRLHYHFDGGQPADGLDIAALLRSPAPGTHVYYCGPPGFMKACAAAASGWPAGSVHFEHFQAPVSTTPAPTAAATPGADAGTVGLPDGRFSVHLQRSGQTIVVEAQQSIVDALAQGGVHIETSCQSGLCGTCKVGYLAGRVDHRDFVLSDDEHTHCLTACVSRSMDAVLTLDL